MYRAIFEEINAHLKALSIDDIKRRLEPVIKGMCVESPTFNPGTYVYRARKFDKDFKKEQGIKYADLIYPPKNKAKLGRLNRDGDPVFYCSLGKEALFFELPDIQTSSELVVTFWRTTETVFVNNIGYTQLAFDKIGAKRACPQWSSVDQSKVHAVINLPDTPYQELNAAIEADSNKERSEAFSENFLCMVDVSETEKYKLTTAIGELHLGSILGNVSQFGGLLYPSVRMWANADNLALLPWFVDRHLSFRKALHIRIDSCSDRTFSISSLDCAKEFDKDGNLIWLGRLPNWSLQPGQGAQFSAVAGRDCDGDYETGKDGVACYWHVVDTLTGEIIEMT